MKFNGRFFILMFGLFLCSRPAVSRGSKAPPKVRQLDRQRDSGKKRRNQPIQVNNLVLKLSGIYQILNLTQYPYLTPHSPSS